MSETPVRGKAAASGNLAILTKIDKLRELTGSRVSLPQVGNPFHYPGHELDSRNAHSRLLAQYL